MGFVSWLNDNSWRQVRYSLPHILVENARRSEYTLKRNIFIHNYYMIVLFRYHLYRLLPTIVPKLIFGVPFRIYCAAHTEYDSIFIKHILTE